MAARKQRDVIRRARAVDGLDRGGPQFRSPSVTDWLETV